MAQWGATADAGGTPIGDRNHRRRTPVDTQCDPPSTSGGHSQVNGHPGRRTPQSMGTLTPGDTWHSGTQKRAREHSTLVLLIYPTESPGV